MLDLTTDANNLHGLKTLRVKEMTQDRRENWDITLQSTSFPTAFENGSPSSRQLNLTVVDGSDFNPTDNPNSFLIPLVLVGTSRVEDKTVCYYRSRHESQEDTILNAKISASITMSDEQNKPVENPHLLMAFDVSAQDNSDRMSGNAQEFSGSRQKSTFVTTTAGENAQGGVDIPMDKMDRDMQPGDKIVVPA